MAFLKVGKVNGEYYVRTVESYRDETGKGRTRTVQSYGRVKRGPIRRMFDWKPSNRQVQRQLRKHRMVSVTSTDG